MAVEALVVIGVLAMAVAFANGANDNFKGVATLHGSGTLSYSSALAWGTLTTLAGSLAAVALSSALVKRFSGKGLVADAVVADPAFLAAVATGAALSVLAATWLGFPVSTTHALTGGLLGAGMVLAGPAQIAYGVLAAAFVLPLALAPLLSALLAAALERGSRWAFVRLRLSEESCVCVGSEAPAAYVPGAGAVPLAAGLTATLDHVQNCRLRYAEGAYGVELASIRDRLHVLSAGAVGFARGLNDTPKIAALLVGAGALGQGGASVLTALAMAAGGVLGARRVAETLSFRITDMKPGEATSANVVTAALVALASPLGLPLSTTHVCCGALFGIGIASGELRRKTIVQILGAWLVTLPIAALAAAAAAAMSR
jgi:PiT family inorganic phosphate transporter